MDNFQWFTIILAMKSKRVENIFHKFNKDKVQRANPLNRFLDLVLLITQKVGKSRGFSFVQMLSGIKMDKIKVELKGYGGITPF